MSVIRDDAIRIVGQTLGIEKLSDEVCAALAPEVEFRLRQLIQEASKFKSHAKRTVLTSQDINDALRARNQECLYGFGSGENLKFVRSEAHPELFFLEDKELELSELMSSSIPKCPLAPTYGLHWLAVEGIQPCIPENETPELINPNKCSLPSSTPANSLVKPLVKHVLSQELQIYFEKVTGAILAEDGKLQRAAYESLRQDPGLQQLLPYLSKFIADKVTQNLRSLPTLLSLVRTVRCLLENPHLQVELYLHQLLPPLMTCLVGRRLCENPTENHWALRDYVAGVIAFICQRFGSAYSNLQPRISKTLHEALSDPKKPLTTHYGAITGIASLGPLSMELLLFPQLRVYCKALEQVMSSPLSSPVQRSEAQHCFGLLVRCVGRYIQGQSGAAAAIDGAAEGGHRPSLAELEDLFGENLLPYMRQPAIAI